MDDYFLSTLSTLSKVNKYNKWMHSCYEKHIGNNVLEIGCGTGNLTELYLEKTESVYATDLSEKLVSFVKNRFSITHPKKFEAFTLDISDDSQIDRFAGVNIDTIICVNVLEHIENDLQALLNMKNILEKGGKIILFVPAWSKLYSYLDKNTGHFRRYDRGQLGSLADKSGLKVIDNFYFNFWGIPIFYIKGKLSKEQYEGETFSTLVGEGSSKLINLASVLLKPLEKLISPVVGVSEIAILQK